MSNDLIILEEELPLRYIRFTSISRPYGQPAALCGLRVFGLGDGEYPKEAVYRIRRTSPVEMEICIEEQEESSGFQILWGHAPDKLYHSCMTYELSKTIKALVSGETYFIRVDSFNENGITIGTHIRQIEKWK